MTKVKKHITLDRLRELQKVICWVDNYLPPDDNEIHHVGKDLETIDEENTKLLIELGQLNLRRNKIIGKLMGEDEPKIDFYQSIKI